MVQIEDFIKRIEFIMNHFNLNASSLADKISVQRSSISHLLSGRNKPSLDFVMKIIDEFPDLNLYWLLNGKGYFLSSNEEEITCEKSKNTSTPSDKNDSFKANNAETNPNKSLVGNSTTAPHENINTTKWQEREIIKIVCFYADGTFLDYKPSDTK